MSEDIRSQFAPDSSDDGRQFAPSATRNTPALVEALTPVLTGRTGLVLEVGAGTGQHSAALAGAFPRLDWQPSDAFEAHLGSVSAWVDHAGLDNLRRPIWLDAAETWPDLGRLSGVFSANVIHISPWAVTQGIVRGAAAAEAGFLAFYGPFREGRSHTGEGNEHFDQTLRAQDPAWGVRDLEDVAELAEHAGFGQPEVTVMPVNNRLLVFQRG